MAQPLDFSPLKVESIIKILAYPKKICDILPRRLHYQLCFLPLKVRESYKIVHYPAIFSAYKSRGINLRLPPVRFFTFNSRGIYSEHQL